MAGNDRATSQNLAPVSRAILSRHVRVIQRRFPHVGKCRPNPLRLQQERRGRSITAALSAEVHALNSSWEIGVSRHENYEVCSMLERAALRRVKKSSLQGAHAERCECTRGAILNSLTKRC